MFIAIAITNQSKLRRSETRGAIYIALLRSCKGKQTLNFIPTGFICPETCSKKQEVRLSLRRGAHVGFSSAPFAKPSAPLALNHILIATQDRHYRISLNATLSVYFHSLSRSRRFVNC